MPRFCNLYSPLLTHSGETLINRFLPAGCVWDSEEQRSHRVHCLLQSKPRATCAAMTWLPVLSVSLLLLCVRDSASLFLPDSNELRQLLSRYEEEADRNATVEAGGSRTRRAIRWSDREEILQLHNKLRGGVYPTASNMEYMVRHHPSYLLQCHPESTEVITRDQLTENKAPLSSETRLLIRV